MPSRPERTTRVDCDPVQGADSYVVLRRLTVGEIDELQRQRTREHWSDGTYSKQIIARRIVEWNWVDFDGAPLPQPKDNPSVIDQLTEDEVHFLSGVMHPEEANQGN